MLPIISSQIDATKQIASKLAERVSIGYNGYVTHTFTNRAEALTVFAELDRQTDAELSLRTDSPNLYVLSATLRVKG